MLCSTENQLTKKPSLFGLNIRSLRFHIDELRIHLQDSDPSVILLTETWLTENDPLKQFDLEGYQPIESKPRKTGIRGGVAFYAKEDIEYQILEYESELECLAGTFKFDEANTKSFCVIYRPDAVRFGKFLELFESLLEFLSTLKNDCIIFGDFNVDTLVDDSENKQYLNLLRAYGFSVQNNEPTRVTSTTATCIDHVSAKSFLKIKTMKLTISDHYGLEAEIPFFPCSKKSFDQLMPLSRNINHIRNNSLNLLFLLDQKLRKIDDDMDIEPFVENIIYCILECVDRFAPERTMKRKKHGSWITNQIKNSIKKRDNLFQNWIKNPTNENHLAFKKVRNQIRSMIRNAKREQNFKELGENPSTKLTYKKLKGRSNYQNNTTDILDVENINKYFSGVGKLLSDQLPDSIYRSQIDQNESSMVLHEVGINEISSIIKKLKNKRSTDPDGISNEILKCCSPVIDEYICKIVNKCIRAECFPRQLKIAKVVPIFKKGDKTQPENYRPISILSPIGKVIEKVLLKQMNSFFTKNNLFSSNQFGFRSKRSCSHAIAEVTDYIRNEIDKRGSGIACFIDLKKAFDTLDHSILLEKLYRYGFRGPVLNIIRHYLTERKQFVQVKANKSSLQSITCGVPQGSVLGPFLFLIYFNDLPKNCLQSKTTLFADDTTVYNLDRNSSHGITSDIQRIRKWLVTNKLTVNVDKCETVGFGRAQPLPNDAFDTELPLKGHCKYLGVQIDTKLNFKDHINYVTKKLNKFCGLMYNIRERFPTRCLLMFYKTMAKPIITYALMVYGGTAKTNLEMIEKAQRRILRAIFYKKRCDSLQNIYERHNILTVHELYVVELVRELFRQLRGKSPFDFVSGNYIPADVNTRRKAKGLLAITYSRTILQRRSLKNTIVRTYNWLRTLDLIPNNLKTLSELSVKSLITNIAINFISNNSEVFSIYF